MRWGGPCVKCGHPAGYHGMTFCRVLAGSSGPGDGGTALCDCDGYQALRADGGDDD